VAEELRDAEPLAFNQWSELYDLSCDPGQRDDIAAKHPAVVKALREGYEAWWDLVSEQAERDIPFHIGADDAEVMLTTHDIRNESTLIAWNQKEYVADW
jgi:hypothetical protein